MIFHDYFPKKFQNPLLVFSAVISATAVAALWYFREALELDISDLLLLSGLSLIIILLTVRDILKKKEYFLKASELKKQREDMDNEDFSDNSIFFN